MKFSRIIKWVLIPPFFLGIVLVSLSVTEQGFRLLVNLADSLSGPAFSVERVEGRLLSAWRLENVRIKLDKGEKNLLTMKIDELAWGWRPLELFRGTLHGEYIRIRGIRVWLPTEEKVKDVHVQEERKQFKLPEINLPIRLIMDELLITDLSVFPLSYPDDYPEPFMINELLVKAWINGNKLRVERFRLANPDFGGEFAAGVDFRNNWPLTLAGDWFATADAGRLDGRIGLDGDLETLLISMEFETPFVAEVNGRVRRVLSDTLDWQVSASSKEIKLNDLGIELPVSGTLDKAEFSGSLQTYKGGLSVVLNYSDKPPVQVETRFDGDLSGVDISFLRFFAGEGVLSIAGRVDWEEGVSWLADLRGEQLTPELFFADWPGKIDLNLNSKGKWADHGLDALRAGLQIEHLDGELRGFPLTGTGSMELVGGELQIDNLFLQSGTTSLQVQGQAGNELDLSFQAESDDLASLLPEGRGSFSAAGKMTGTREAPHITFDLNGTGLGFKEHSIDEIEAEINADISSTGRIKAEIKGSGINAAGEYIDQVQVNLTGDQEEHTLVMAAVADLGRLDLGFTGGLRDKQWQGELDMLNFSSERFGKWQTEHPAVLRIGGQQAGVADFLLGHGQMLFSLDGGWEKESGWYIKSGLDNFSLQLLKEWGFAVSRLDGIVTACLTARGAGAVLDQAELVVSLPDLVLTGEEEGGKVRKWSWPENNVAINIGDGEAKITALSIFEDGSKGELNAVVGNIDFSEYQPAEMILSGNLEAVISDISFLTPLSGYMVMGIGGFDGNARLSGTVAAPVVHGDFSLDDGEILVPAVNISMNRLEFSLAGDGRNNTVDILAASGEGMITAAGEINHTHDNQWLADISIHGERFKIVNLDEYQAEISPDIRLLYNNKDGISMRGVITVPMAYIAPEEFQRGVVAGSADVVVIDYKGQKQQKTNLPLSFDIAVILGEDVKIDAFGLHGHLDGRLGVVGSPGKVVTAFGSLKLHEGIFIFSDAELEISRGLIFYQGGGVANPGLDIRAERKVSGKEVGVLITGTASRMEFDLFSTPPMDNADILSYIVTGKKMSAGGGGGEGAMLKAAAASLGKWTGGKITDELEEFTGLDINLAGSGNGGGFALVVGREIADGLYISYGKNLTDSPGTFRARYDINWGLSVETESSAEETGVDLFWSWER